MLRSLTIQFLVRVALAVFITGPAAAGPDIPRPPSVLSPDLTEPWLIQLGRHNQPVISYPTVTRPVRVEPMPTQTSYRPMTPAQAGPMDPRFLPQEVAYRGNEAPGTIVIDTNQRFLFLVQSGGKALRYGVGVGRPGFEWAGIHHITRKAEWPDWTPPPEMLQRQPNLPRHMDGGPRNPLGARALYIGSTMYRIHGSNEPWTIGHAVSSGCIRMRNEDVIDLYGRVKVGTKVIVI